MSLECDRHFETEEISGFLEEPEEPLRLSKDSLERYGSAVDIVTPSSTRSACFTKSYGSYFSGCGSYLCSRCVWILSSFSEMRPFICELCCSRLDFVEGKRLTVHALADPLQLVDVVRSFSPREVANLMCFPVEFNAPPHITVKQMYRCLGNSVNMRVVAALLRTLLQT